MSYDYKLDNNGDIDFEYPNVTGLEKAKQQILSMIRTGKGGWNYDKNIGHLFKDYILDTMPPDYISFFQSLVQEIEKIEYVKKANVINYQIDHDRDTLILSLEVFLTTGERLQLDDVNFLE